MGKRYLDIKPGSVEEAIAKSINAELSPKQKKLDKNNNGKIDAQDLAKLRAKKEQKKNKQDVSTAEPEEGEKSKTDTGKKPSKIDTEPEIIYNK